MVWALHAATDRGSGPAGVVSARAGTIPAMVDLRFAMADPRSTAADIESTAAGLVPTPVDIESAAVDLAPTAVDIESAAAGTRPATTNLAPTMVDRAPALAPAGRGGVVRGRVGGVRRSWNRAFLGVHRSAERARRRDRCASARPMGVFLSAPFGRFGLTAGRLSRRAGACALRSKTRSADAPSRNNRACPTTVVLATQHPPSPVFRAPAHAEARPLSGPAVRPQASNASAQEQPNWASAGAAAPVFRGCPAERRRTRNPPKHPPKHQGAPPPPTTPRHPRPLP